MSPMRLSIQIKKSIFWLSSILLALLLVIVSQHTVSASSDDIQTKSKMTALYFCYNSASVHSSVPYSSWHSNGIASLTIGGNVYTMDNASSSMTGTLCSTLIGSFSNKIPNNKSASQSESDSFFKSMGYNIETEGEDQGYCAIYRFSKNEGATISEYRMCDPEATVNENGEIIISGKNLNYTFMGEGEAPLVMSFWRTPGVSGGTQHTKMSCVHSGNAFNKGWPVVIKGEDFTKYANEVFRRIYGCNQGTEMEGLKGGWQVNGDQAEVISNQKVTYILPKDRTSASIKAIQYLFDDKAITSISKLKLTINQEKEVLTNALNNYYHFAFFGNTEENGCNLDDTAKENAKSLGYIELKTNKTTVCYVKATGDNEKKKVRLYNNSTKLLDGTEMDFATVVKALSELAEKNDIELDLKPTPIDGGTTEGGDSGTDNRCFAAAASLGWIVCPVIQAVGNAVEGIYNNVVAPFLTIDAQYFSTTGDRSGIYDGWNAFREFANIVFVILFVIVILAQVTGIGISNYNIKKILPRLVVIVILVNVSFIICQLAVDLSNILGYQLNNLFANQLASNITIEPINGEDVSYTLGGIVSVITTVLAGGAGYLAVVNWQLWIIPLLLALLSCGIGILFFFVILGVRQAGVIILAVLAPVAIVCYALPNTKSIFDKWSKLFTSLLILYPLCGILMGGGAFASKLLIAVNGGENFFYTLVAMLLTVVPFFFIPTLLKSSMAALGNIGTKISNMGKSWSSAANRRISGTDTVNDWKRQLDKRHNLSVANRLDRRLARRRNANPNATLSAGAMRRLARSKVAYQNSMLDEGNNQFIAESMTPESIQQALDTQQFEQEQRLINNAAQSISAGSASYTDALGNSQKINVNDLANSSVNSLSSAFQSLRSQYDASGGTDRQIGNQMNAIAKTMISRYGDKGRSLVMESLKGDADSTGTFNRTASFNSLSNYISRDEKWMSALKKEDPGAFEMISDGANATGAMRNLQAYNSAGSSKVTASSVPNLSEDFFTGYEKAINNAKQAGVFSTGSAANTQQITDFEKMVQSFEQAAADPIISRSIKDGDLAYINNINKALYEAKRDGWKSNNPGKTDADYAAQFGNYRDIAIGQSVKISHKQMPTGWHRATTAEAITHGARVGFSEGDWIDGSGSTPTRLSTADQKRAEAIEDYNIKADLNNNP